MDLTANGLELVPIHKRPELISQCCDMINEEWPRSETYRLKTLESSCDNLPTSLALVQENNLVVGHCKLTKLPRISEACYAEVVVIDNKLRGKGLGRILMLAVEDFCKTVLQLKGIFLSTKGQEGFYEKLGYERCPPVTIYGGFEAFNEPIKSKSSTASFVPSRTDLLEASTSSVCCNNCSRSSNLFNMPLAPPPPPPPMPPTQNKTATPTKTFMKKMF